ncbi:MAG: uridine kinase [Nitrospiraceae bacterium]|nr:uridine kinase [Nitrospiraceae bacterium]
MNERPRIIAIAGPSCSGKTALANHLVESLAEPGAAHLPLDAYYRDLTGMTPAQRARWNFDDPASLEKALLIEHFAALTSGETIHRPVYNFATHARKPLSVLLAPAPFIVLEGIYALYWREVRAFLDLSVFINLDDATCLARRIVRDTHERRRAEQSIRTQYARTVRPMYEQHVEPTKLFADLLLDGRQSTEELAVQVLSALHSADSPTP